MATRGATSSGGKLGIGLAVGAVALLAVAAGVAGAQEAATGGADEAAATALDLGKVFTLLFLTLGPFKIIGPFAKMTRGRDDAFRRRLAFEGIVIATIATLAAATIGASILRKWDISLGALELTAGIVLFLVALRPVLAQYEPEPRPEPPPPEADPPSTSALAFAPLAFPTIVTPYGIAVLIILVSLRTGETPLNVPVLGVAIAVLAVDLLAMLAADRILRTPFVASLLGIVGAVIGVLQVALGVQAAVSGLRLLGFA